MCAFLPLSENTERNPFWRTKDRCLQCAQSRGVPSCSLQVRDLTVTVTLQAFRGLITSEARDLTRGVERGPVPLREGHESNKEDAVLDFEVHRFSEHPKDHLRRSALPPPVQIAQALTATEWILHAPVNFTPEMPEGPSHGAGRLHQPEVPWESGSHHLLWDLSSTGCLSGSSHSAPFAIMIKSHRYLFIPSTYIHTHTVPSVSLL